MKKLIVSICTLALSAIMLCSSTYAWFSMNQTVEAGGMTVKASVSSNLFIDQKASGSWATNDSTFTSAITVASADTKLAPVSTTDGKNFFFVDPSNVKGDGSVKNVTYKAYNQTDFNNMYNGTQPYVEYTFVLKAQNVSDASAQNIVLNKLELHYNGTTDGNKAYRVALIFKEFAVATENGAKTDPEAATNGTSVLYAPEGAVNYTSGKAVSGTDALDDVTYVSTQSAMAEVPASTTKYYDVVVRLWLEGEDKTCNVEQFKLLSENWTLSVGFELSAVVTTAVTKLDMTTTA